MKKPSILMVCTANICRSPTAHGLLKHLLDLKGLNGHFAVDSAGTHVFQKGLHPDVRAQQVALEQGIDLSDLRSRKIRPKDFAVYDYILTMDNENYHILQQLCPDEHSHKISMVMEYAPESGVLEVPDPYFGNIAGFERVFDMLEVAMKGLVEQLHNDENLRI
jgi:protein-tyrosine phosphatase